MKRSLILLTLTYLGMLCAGSTCLGQTAPTTIDGIPFVKPFTRPAGITDEEWSQMQRFAPKNKIALPKSTRDAMLNPVAFVDLPLVPGTVRPGSGAFVLAVHGSQFVQGSTINWNGSALPTTFVSSTRLAAIVPASNVAGFGTASVTVSSPGPGGGVSNAVPFTIREPVSAIKFASSTINVGVSPTSVVVADFNHDGTSDLAVVNSLDPGCNPGQLGTISILLGNGDGTFTSKPKLCPPGGGPAGPALLRFVTAGDFNGDGKQDLVVTSDRSGLFELEVYLGNGDGTFTYSSDQGGWDGIAPIVTGDFDRDGKLDLAMEVDFEGVGIVEIWSGVGDGSFAFKSSEGLASELGSPTAMNDFNQDGILDLSSIGSTGNGNVFLGNGDGTFTAASSQPSTPGVLTGDFNRDGIPDLTGLGRFLKGNGDGTFTDIGPGPNDLRGTVADFNGDHALDIAGLGSNNNVLLYLGNGNGTFRRPVSIPVGNAPSAISAGDFNGDGGLDLAVANAADNTVTILLQVPKTTTALASSQNPSVFGQPVTFSATVLQQGNAAPTGTVTFMDGNTVLGIEALVAERASLTTSALITGQHVITAVYSGSAVYQPSMSSPLTQVVNRASAQCKIHASKIVINNQVEYKITSPVARIAPGNGIPTGEVTFWDSAFTQIVLGEAPLVSGKASITVELAPEPNPQWLKAVYPGDSNFEGCASPYLAIFQ
jgi:hypothetical protein